MQQPPAPGQTRELSIPGPAGAIEALWSAPRTLAARPGFALVCHPHPLFGGAMGNKVVYTLASCAQKAGWHALRYNVRGVGASAGAHDRGQGETDDLVFLADWMRAQLPGAGCALMGFSFGGWVALRAAARVRPIAQVSVAPPLAESFYGEPPPSRPDCPWLLIHGLDDEVVPYADSKPVIDGYSPPPQQATPDGVGHFFHGRLGEITDTVLPFLRGLA